MMQRTTLNEWLQWLEGLHVTTIDMGLERVRKVWHAMQVQPAFPVIMVAGTNGKGSVCAMLSTMYQRAGFKVGCYTSPHIQHYNERVAIDLKPVSDERIINSFAAIDAARGDTSLTYFEFELLVLLGQTGWTDANRNGRRDPGEGMEGMACVSRRGGQRRAALDD